MRLKDFLERVLPSDGYKCWVEINRRKKVIQGFTPSIDELTQKLAEIDARGSDAYFACASYRTPDNRQSANALAAKAFWLDIDAGEGKPYATAEDAIQACDDFCNRYGLPLPGIVRSGSGTHGYWILDQPLDSTIWVGAAARLKLLTNAAGFLCDPSRTADIASILRPPETHNRKRPDARLVEIDSDDGWDPISATGFLEFLVKTPLPSAKPIENEIKAPCVTAAVPSNADLLAGTSKAFDPTKGVEAGRRGSTQLRYAGELVAKGYCEEDVLQLCRDWNQLCTPPQEDKEVVRIVRSAFSMHQRKHPPVAPPEELPAVLRALPYGYSLGPRAQVMVKNKDDELRSMSKYSVYLLSILNHEYGGRHNSYLFRQFNPIDGWNEFCMDSDGVNGQQFYVQWYRNGGSVQAGMDNHFRTYIREAENMLRSEKETTRYSQFGWKENNTAFLVGDVLIRNGRPHKAHGTDKLTPLMRTMILPKEGSLEEWTTAANKFFTPGMEAHGFALLTSFAAPLIKFCAGLGDGGSILSLLSEESGRGKTPVAEAIASVWGDLDSTLVTGNFTENRRIESIVRHCNLPQVQEEMTLSDPSIAAESVKKFTTGCDRGRLSRSGAAQDIPERYQTILVSIANNSLYEMVAVVDRAASRRIFELDIKRPDNDAFANLGGITREMMRCRGYAGRRYAQIITTEGYPQYLREHLTGVSQERPGSTIMRYRNILETESEHRFIVWLLAAVDVAARLVTHHGILHFDVDRIMNWAVDQARERVDDRDIEDPAMKLQRFLGENIGGCLVVSDAFDSRGIVIHTEPKNHLVMRLEIKTKKLYISNDNMKQWCIKNRMSFVQFCKNLIEHEIAIERSRPVTLGAGTMLPSARTYCLEVDMSHPAMSGLLKEVKAVAKEKTA